MGNLINLKNKKREQNCSPARYKNSTTQKSVVHYPQTARMAALIRLRRIAPRDLKSIFRFFKILF
jgi:hypothetical protein